MTNTRTLKVNIPLSVEIDIDAWIEEYGTNSAAEIRGDVKEHIRQMVLGQLDSLGVLA